MRSRLGGNWMDVRENQPPKAQSSIVVTWSGIVIRTRDWHWMKAHFWMMLTDGWKMISVVSRGARSSSTKKPHPISALPIGKLCPLRSTVSKLLIHATFNFDDDDRKNIEKHLQQKKGVDPSDEEYASTVMDHLYFNKLASSSRSVLMQTTFPCTCVAGEQFVLKMYTKQCAQLQGPGVLVPKWEKIISWILILSVYLFINLLIHLAICAIWREKYSCFQFNYEFEKMRRRPVPLSFLFFLPLLPHPSLAERIQHEALNKWWQFQHLNFLLPSKPNSSPDCTKSCG